MKRCEACPFNDGLNEEATMAQNLACLPSAQEMIETLDNEGVAMSCHERQMVACSGLSGCRDTRNKEVWPYSKWYRGER